MKRGISNTTCANCGVELRGEFCHECGQERVDLHVSFIHVISHFLGDYFTFDSKLFRSLLPLLIKPGFLTTEYMSGHRVRYIPPVRSYVFISILFFLLSSLQPLVPDAVSGIKVDGEPIVVVDPQSLAALKESKPSTQKELDELKTEGARTLSGGDDEFEQLLLTRLDRIQKDTAGFQDAFNRNLPKIMFFLLPIFALILKLLYIRNGRILIEHLIFALHFHSFLFLVLSINIPIKLALMGTTADWVPNLIVFPILAYLLFAMKKHYNQSIGRTIGKFFALLASYLMVVSITLLGLLIYTFFAA